MLPAIVNCRKALDPDAPLIRDDKVGQVDNLASPLWEAGDKAQCDRVFAEADVIAKRTVLDPRSHPCPMETCGMVADMNPATGQLNIYNANQAPHAHRTVYAQVAGLPEQNIRILCNDIGGGFGNKVPVYPGYVCAIAGSIVAGAPVKWIEDRSENLASTGFARDYLMYSEMCSKGGKITGLRVDTIADHGAFDSTAQATKFPAGFFHIVTGSYDLAGRALPGQGRVHEQGARRRRLPLLVPHHRGRLPRRADGRCAGDGDERRPDRAAHEAASSGPTSSRTRRRPAGSTTRATTTRP